MRARRGAGVVLAVVLCAATTVGWFQTTVSAQRAAATAVTDIPRLPFEKFTLPNGLHFILIERHEAPVVSFQTYVNVGSVDDPSGQTGLAHMFEHMAFKGTPLIGTKNWVKEKAALDGVEKVYDRYDGERAKGRKIGRAHV